MVMSILQKALRRGPAPSTQRHYQKLVIAIAEGQNVPEHIEDLLDGRRLEDFERDVARYRERLDAQRELASVPKLQKAFAEATANVQAAEKALLEHPLVKLRQELQGLQARHEEAKAMVTRARSDASKARSHALQVLQGTCSRELIDKQRELSDRIGAWQRGREKIELRDDERRAKRQAESDLARLPSRIESAGPDERALLTARLVAQKAVAEGFAEREREMDRIDGEIAKLEGEITKISDSYLRPEAMEFTSKPKREEL